MEKLNEKEYANLPVGNTLFDKAMVAVAAGISKVFTDYAKMNKGTIHPNTSEKALHGSGMSGQGNMGSEKQNMPNG